MSIMFEVPAKYAAQIAVGQVRRVGVNLINSADGRILGHVQETSRLVGALANATNPINAAGSIGAAASGIAANIQLEQVKQSLGMLQIVSGATLALSAVNLGVSVAGFVVLGRKLNRLSRQVGDLEKHVSDIRGAVHRINHHDRARDRAALISIMALGDEAWFRSDATDVWRELASAIMSEESYYRALLETDHGHDKSVICNPVVNLGDATAAYETLCHLMAARLQCLLLLNELDAARHYVEQSDEWIRRNFQALTPPKIVGRRAESGGAMSPEEQDDRRLEMLTDAELLAAIIREQQEFVNSTPHLLDTIVAKGIHGRDYVHHLRHEPTEPVLVLEAAGAS